MSKPQAFIDSGFSPGQQFCVEFLSSPDFKGITLQNLDTSELQKDTKKNRAKRIYQELEKGNISANRILLAYVKQPRQWLSIKTGQSIEMPQLVPPEKLLTEFGSNTWYGPITTSSKFPQWYVRTYEIPDYAKVTIEQTSEITTNKIRWTVIAEVGKDYLALSWNGFTHTQVTEDSNKQFPFWKKNYIPQCFDELSKRLQGSWRTPNLHGLVLDELWDRYITNSDYRWRHLRIRAEASGVALNAHSSGVLEINTRGLQALSRTLAESALESLALSKNIKQVDVVENALLRTLIKGWGTKSYEFSLDNIQANTDENQQPIRIFKAHCYFGLKPESKTQDSLQHFKCYSGYYGGSTNALRFLLKELGLGG